MATLADSGLSARGGKRLTALIWGPAKGRKTVTAHGMPRTRTLDFDDGLLSVEWAILAGVLDKKLEEVVYETILGDKKTPKGVVDMLDVACDHVDRWIEEEDEDPIKEWDTLIVDSCSFMNDGAMSLAVKENKRIGMSKSLDRGLEGLTKKQKERGLWVQPMERQDWGAANRLFQNAVAQWKALGKNLVLIAHEYIRVSEGEKTEGYEPLLIGQLRTKIPAMMDEVWYCKPQKGAKGIEVYFKTVPDGRRALGSRVGCLDEKQKADFREIRKKISAFYGIPEDQVWKTLHGTRGRKRAEEEAAQEASLI